MVDGCRLPRFRCWIRLDVSDLFLGTCSSCMGHDPSLPSASRIRIYDTVQYTTLQTVILIFMQADCIMHDNSFGI